jgi:hypothetical protein
MVRLLIDQKKLSARKLGEPTRGAQWILSEASVNRFAAIPRKRGKPFAKPDEIKAASRTRRKYARNP